MHIENSQVSAQGVSSFVRQGVQAIFGRMIKPRYRTYAHQRTTFHRTKECYGNKAPPLQIILQMIAVVCKGLK